MNNGTVQRRAWVFGILLLLAIVLAQPVRAATDSCDRSCLIGFVDQYLQALVAHDPGRLPVTKDVRFTENTEQLNLGDALWLGASGIGDYKIYSVDPATSQVGFMGVIIENGAPRLYAMRLKVRDRRISEVETIVARSGQTPIPLPPDLLTRRPKPIFSEVLQPGERVSRSAMIAAANQYFEGIEQNSGEIVPFDSSCNRTENGIQTTNNASLAPPGPGGKSPTALGCKDQFNTGTMFWTIPERRFWLVDEAHGLVIGAITFASNGRGPGGKPVPPAGDGPAPLGPMVAHNVLVELFKIKNGRIYQIEAVLGPMLPYGARTGW
jgi:hypothetical protein